MKAKTAPARIREIIAGRDPTDSYKYMLLDRMRTDCGYFLGYGNRNPGTLWGQDVNGHLEAMRLLWESFPEGDRPEWLTAADLEELRQRMTAPPAKYQFECMNAFIDGVIINDFSGDAEAIQYAANYEAYCYRLRPEGGRDLIYRPGQDPGQVGQEGET